MASFPVVGDELGAYRITGRLGSGGMGVVYAAEPAGGGRSVALKVLAPALAVDPGHRERFFGEAAALARIDSPHVVPLLDHGEHDGWCYLVTSCVSGGDLGQALRDHGPLRVEQATRIMAQLARALAAAHDVGILHRDLKPANVLLDDSGADVTAHLCDFGIAQAGHAAPGLTTPGLVAGTYAYLAPERLRGEPATAQSDLYALGCVLWAALTGAPPYAGSDVEVALAHLQAPLPRFPGTSPEAEAVNDVLQRCLAKDPRRRYRDAAAASLALDGILHRLERREAYRSAPPRHRRSTRLVVGALVGALAMTPAGDLSATRSPPATGPSASPAAAGVRLTLGSASLRAPRGWSLVTPAGRDGALVGARDRADHRGYYSSVLLQATPGTGRASLPRLRRLAARAAAALAAGHHQVRLVRSTALAPRRLAGARAARTRAVYHHRADDLDVIEEVWVAEHDEVVYRITFQHSRGDSRRLRRAQIDPVVASFRWTDRPRSPALAKKH